MRKLVLSAMALAMTVALVGCGEEKKTVVVTPTTPTTTVMTTPMATPDMKK